MRLLETDVRGGSTYRRYGKRSFDVAAGSLLAIALLPPMVGIALLAPLWLGTPVLFRQRRPGRHGRIFELLKFRTMSAIASLPDEERLTAFGRCLRASSLDELPELWNVLKGDMSLVGPRPLLVRYLDRYTPEEARRHEVKPGITGWAQVNGRNALDWPDKFKLDAWYVDHCCFTLDLKILAMTAWQVLARRGINQPGHATAQEFMGSAR